MESLRAVEKTGVWPERIAEGFTSLVPKGEGGTYCPIAFSETMSSLFFRLIGRR